MKIKRRSSITHNLAKALLLAALYIIASPIFSHAELKLESVYPTLGQMGQDLEVTLIGTGFDANTRISMYLDSCNQRMLVGSVEIPYLAHDVFVLGSYAYVVARDYEGIYGCLEVIDISNPSIPQIEGSVATPSYARGVFVSRSYAYVADDVSGLQVIDISNPQSPQITAYVDTPGSAHGISVSGNYAYVADYTSGLQVIDISDPQSPQIVGSVDTPGSAESVFVYGNYAYVADSYSGLQVIDISNPSSPEIIGSIVMPSASSVIDVFVSGNYAYVVDGYCLQVINISDPENLQHIMFLDTPSVSNSIFVSGSYAYVADGEGGLLVIDISNPLSPQIIGPVDTRGIAYGVFVSESYAYVADFGGGLHVIDISNLPSPQITGSVDTLYGRRVTVSGSYAYVADFNNGLYVIDISDPSSPLIVGSVDTPGYARGLFVSGSYAYVADDVKGLQVIDISNPAEPEITGSVDTACEAWSIFVSGDYAYVADYNSGLQVINISNPTKPEIIVTVDTSGEAWSIFVSGDYAYVGSFDFSHDYYGGLEVIDISNPSSPQIKGSVGTPGWAWDVFVSGSYAYVADFDYGLQVIDISDPEIPEIIESAAYLGKAYDVLVSGTYAYLAHSTGIYMIDITNPSNPLIIGSVDTPGFGYGISVSGGYAYVAEGDAVYGLNIVPLPVEIIPATVNSPASISVILPSPLLAGIYNLRVFNETENSELLGAVSFTGDTNTLKSKAIIVAGGGPEASGGTMWEETKVSANKAYDALILQGYQHDSIYYISEDTLNEYIDSSSYETFLSDLHSSITEWAADASQLLIYFVDHGLEDEFILHEDSDTTLTLTTQELDSWLDELQETMNGPVTFIYDACQSGSFISKMQPPEGKDRIVITGASYEPAYFLENGEGSFSFHFWDKTILNRGNIGDAFLYAKDSMQSYQSATIEANWDSEGNTNESEDISIAEDMTIQRGGYAYIGVHPFITSVSDPQILSSGTSATIWASGVIDSENVSALIIPPDINPETSDIPITDLDMVELTDPDGDHTYEGVYDGFDTEGTYVVVIKSKATRELYSYVSKTITTYNIYSPPMCTSVTKSSGIQNIEPDGHEEDDTYSQAGIIILNDDEPQAHNFHDIGDEDWVKFYGISGQIYKIKAGNVSVVCDPIIKVFDNDGTTLLAGPINNGGEGEDESLEWICPKEGLYYVEITNTSSNYGENVRYELKVYRPIAGIPGWLTGIVMNFSGQMIRNAVIKSSVSNGTAITNSMGYYEISLPSGTYTITSGASGYEQKSATGVVISAQGKTTQNFVLYRLIDTDDDGLLDDIEALLGTDPYDADTDDDGMPDGWEVDYGLNPLIDDASDDPDHDGYTNLQEYNGNGDPNDPNTPSYVAMPMVDAGWAHTVGLNFNSTAVAVGYNYDVQCNVNVSAWIDIVQVAAGGPFTVGLKSDGTVIDIIDISGWSDIVQVEIEQFHVIGLKSDGTVVADGYNAYGQCDVSGWSDIVQVAAGCSNTVGLKSDGIVVAVGDNGYGQCNVSGWSDIVQVAAGCSNTVGLKSDGIVVAVGDNGYGQCNVSGWSDIVQVAAGCSNTVGLKSDGIVVAVGDNGYGQCNVSGWSDIVQVAAGRGHTVGLKSDGTVVAVGDNEYGQCNVSGWDLGAAQLLYDYDKDYDNIYDYWEYKYFGDTSRDGTDDYDSDELTNLEEYENGTDPTKTDTDEDGMPDGWEVTYGLNPLIDDASDDPDHDGYTNLQEYREGGDPNNSATPFPWEMFYPAFTGKK
jgi:hypothetical protein